MKMWESMKYVSDDSDAYFGKLQEMHKPFFRCAHCFTESTNEMKVNKFRWEKSVNAFCSKDCAESWADGMYINGYYPIPYPTSRDQWQMKPCGCPARLSEHHQEGCDESR